MASSPAAEFGMNADAFVELGGLLKAGSAT